MLRTKYEIMQREYQIEARLTVLRAMTEDEQIAVATAILAHIHSADEVAFLAELDMENLLQLIIGVEFFAGDEYADYEATLK